MGIKYLNSFLRENCKNSINQIHLKNLRNKKIVIDISIYLYKFMSDDALLENVYVMISMFKEYNIKPLFVFDGVPPKEKLPLLEIRKEAKKNASIELKLIKEKILTENDKNIVKEMEEQIDQLKKKCVKIHSKDISQVKELMDAYGVHYVDALGEADELCAYLVINNYAHACISEDMDMFVYGCPRVLRYLSLLKKTCIMYDYKNIINELTINTNEFRQICISSGTDYNKEYIHLYKILDKFKKYRVKNTDKNIDFFTWLNDNCNYYKTTCLEDFYNIENMFKNIHIEKDSLYDIKFTVSMTDTIKLINIMTEEGFIFPMIENSSLHLK